MVKIKIGAPQPNSSCAETSILPVNNHTALEINLVSQQAFFPHYLEIYLVGGMVQSPQLVHVQPGGKMLSWTRLCSDRRLRSGGCTSTS